MATNETPEQRRECEKCGKEMTLMSVNYHIEEDTGKLINPIYNHLCECGHGTLETTFTLLAKPFCDTDNKTDSNTPTP